MPGYIAAVSMFNNNRSAPLVYEFDSGDLNLLGAEDPQPTYHCLDLSWSDELRNKLRELIEVP